jgi:hypothetical protein
MPKNTRYGHEYIIPTGRQARAKIVQLGLKPEPWETIDFPDIPAVGNFSAHAFDAGNWKPNYPNPAFRRTNPDDAFWAAKIVMTFTDADIRALVETGQYSDPRAVDYITSVLIERRNRIGRTWFAKVLPLDQFRFEGGQLRWIDLAERYGFRSAQNYDVDWSRFDNRTAALTRLASAQGCGRGGNLESYCAARIRPLGTASGPSVTVYVRGDGKVVGVDRDDSQPGTPTTMSADRRK